MTAEGNSVGGPIERRFSYHLRGTAVGCSTDARVRNSSHVKAVPIRDTRAKAFLVDSRIPRCKNRLPLGRYFTWNPFFSLPLVTTFLMKAVFLSASRCCILTRAAREL